MTTLTKRSRSKSAPSCISPIYTQGLMKSKYKTVEIKDLKEKPPLPLDESVRTLFIWELLDSIPKGSSAKIQPKDFPDYPIELTRHLFGEIIWKYFKGKHNEKILPLFYVMEQRTTSKPSSLISFVVTRLV